MSGLVDRIAEVIAAADPCYYGDQHDYDKAAEAVVAELQLTEERGWVSNRHGVLHHAIVGWTAVEEKS